MFRTFNAVNMGSVGQRAAKILSVKVGSLKKKSALAQLESIGPRSRTPGAKSFSKFDG